MPVRAFMQQGLSYAQRINNECNIKNSKNNSIIDINNTINNLTKNLKLEIENKIVEEERKPFEKNTPSKPPLLTHN